MVVICGAGETHVREPDGGVIKPTLMVEVTSRNTEKRDRGIKLDDYRLVSSLPPKGTSSGAPFLRKRRRSSTRVEKLAATNSVR